jgi:hypothetical protein
MSVNYIDVVYMLLYRVGHRTVRSVSHMQQWHADRCHAFGMAAAQAIGQAHKKAATP